MAKYQSQESKINKFITNSILPALFNSDLDYKKVVKTVAFEKGVKEEKVEQSLKALIDMGKIKEIHILTVPDKDFEDILKNKGIVKKELEKEFKRVENQEDN